VRVFEWRQVKATGFISKCLPMHRYPVAKTRRAGRGRAAIDTKRHDFVRLGGQTRGSEIWPFAAAYISELH